MPSSVNILNFTNISIFMFNAESIRIGNQVLVVIAVFLARRALTCAVSIKRIANCPSHPTSHTDVNLQLLHASEKGDFAATVISLANGADPNTSNEIRQKPLHLAALKNNVAVAEALIHAGAKLESTDELGRTPLHLAVQSASIKMTVWLLDHGAKYNSIDQNNKTPYDLARKIGNKRTVALFENRFHRSIQRTRNSSGGCTKIPFHYYFLPICLTFLQLSLNMK
jgi:ankyrin repeat protein